MQPSFCFEVSWAGYRTRSGDWQVGRTLVRTSVLLLRKNQFIRVSQAQAVITSAVLDHDFALLSKKIFRS
jgi:hypothetical protein